MSETESEAKWILNEAAWASLKQLLPQMDTLEQSNHFFDSSNGQLRQAKWALRLRKENHKEFLTAKGPAEITGKVVHRPEIEVEVSPDHLKHFDVSFRLSEIPLAPCEVLQEKFGNLEMQKFLSFYNQRQILLWEGQSLELDCSECLGQKRYELEWEAPADILDQNLPKLEKWLQEEKIETTNSTMGKLSWALSLHKI